MNQSFLNCVNELWNQLERICQKGNDINPTLTLEKRKRKLMYNNFGYFFRPSQDLIASGVLENSKSLLEDERLASKRLNLIPTVIADELGMNLGKVAQYVNYSHQGRHCYSSWSWRQESHRENM